MARHYYPGYPVFLDAAAAELGRADALGAARRVSALAGLSHLCAQAADVASDDDARAILDQAAEFLVPLRLALRAGELILDDVIAGRARSDPPAVPTRPTGARPATRKGRGE